MTTQDDSLFITYARDLFAAEKVSAQALKDHPQIPVLIDILSRKDNHHVALTDMSSEKIYLAFLESIALHLVESNAPKSLRDIDFMFLDAKRLQLCEENKEKIAKDFTIFCEEIRAINKRIIIALNQFDTNSFFEKLLQSILPDTHWRLIILTDQAPNSSFIKTKFTEPSDTQLVALLKTFKTELENFHHVLIPDDTFASALSMASHFLTSYSNFDRALELLDSAAGRASTVDYNDHSGQFKAMVTNTTLASVVSSWTQIPISHLHHNAFQTSKFTESIQRRIFGQDAAISTIGSMLQHACIKIHEKPGPLCSFLLVGPIEVGKRSTACAIAEHLFGHKKALLKINLSENFHSLSEVKIMTEDNHGISLLAAIQNTPYAVILMENIHQAPASAFNLFKNIFTQGFALDEHGMKCDFRHAIFVITTSLGADRITTLVESPTTTETNKTLDLMQLVLNEHPQNSAANIHHHLTTQEICDELIPTLEGYFSQTLLQHLHIVPFLPLDYAAYEKIMRIKVKTFAKRLESHFGIELNCAPEVIKFLAHEALWRKTQIKSMDKMLENYLYSIVANEIVAHAEDKNRPKRLLLQLNDEGQLLRCEFVSAMNAAVL